MDALKKASDIKLENLVDIPIPADVQISKRHVVYTLVPGAKSGEHKTSSLWLAEFGKNSSARQITSGKFHDRKPKWSPDGDRIAFLADREKTGKSCGIYILSISGGEAYPITPVENEKTISSFEWSPNGQFIAYLSADEKTTEKKKSEEEKDDAKVYGEDWQYTRLRVLHVQTRKVVDLVKADYHITGFTWSPDSKEIAFIKTKTPQLDSAFYFGVDFERVSLQTKENNHICSFPSRAVRLVWTRDLPGNENRDMLYFLSGHNPKNHGCTSTSVYQLLLSDGTYQRTTGLTSGEECDVDLMDGLVFWSDKKAPTVFVKIQYGLTDSVSTLHGDYACARENEIISWDARLVETDDHDHIHAVYAIAESTTSRPPEVYCVGESGSATQLSNHSTLIRALDISTGERFNCRASDGTILESAVYKPPGATGPLPTIVLIHGGPYWRTPLCFLPNPWTWAPYLISAGYAILCPNYRGSAGRGEAFSSYAAGTMGQKDYTDVIDALKAAVAEKIVDPEKVVVGGWSQGGFLSYLCAVRDDFPFRGAICGAGVTDWDSLCMSSDIPFFEAALTGRAPWAARDKRDTEGRKGSAVWEMAATKPEDRTPVLILHGEEDKRVPLIQAVAFHRGCLEVGWPCEFVTYPREGHMIEERGHHIDVLKRVRAFCDLHLR